ncbi:MAG TPA: SRPBCC family protein [Bacillota bacterium]|nr:SRPBCC family protein [Bacillota bacterium]
METVEKTIEVEAPLTQVYNQWTLFEQFPEFMEGVEEVQQLDNGQLHWVAEIAGRKKEWNAEIIEQVPEQRIAWRSTSGVTNAGVVCFRPRDHEHTLVTLQLDFEPEGALERAGDFAGALSRRIEGDLKRFRDFIQQRATEPDVWHGEIRGGKIRPARNYGSTGKSGLL